MENHHAIDGKSKPLHNELEIHHAIDGKIHYFDWAIFNSYVNVYQRVPHFSSNLGRVTVALGEFPTDHPIFWKSAVPGISKPRRGITIDVGCVSMYTPTNMAMEVGFSMVIISLTSNASATMVRTARTYFYLVTSQ